MLIVLVNAEPFIKGTTLSTLTWLEIPLPASITVPPLSFTKVSVITRLPEVGFSLLFK